MAYRHFFYKFKIFIQKLPSCAFTSNMLEYSFHWHESHDSHSLFPVSLQTSVSCLPWPCTCFRIWPFSVTVIIPEDASECCPQRCRRHVPSLTEQMLQWAGRPAERGGGLVWTAPWESCQTCPVSWRWGPPGAALRENGRSQGAPHTEDSTDAGPGRTSRRDAERLSSGSGTNQQPSLAAK